MTKYAVYGSEDEGFRFPIGKTVDTLNKAIDKASKHFNSSNQHGEASLEQCELVNFTQQQLQNTGQPDHCGNVIKIFCHDGPEYLNMADDPENGYAYDWIYIIEM